MTTVNTTVLKSVQTDILFQISAPSAANGCVNEAQKCANYGHADCKADKYSGDKATTIDGSGSACAQWSVYGYSYQHNYCRNPDADAAPWCIRTNGAWGYCFPKCGMYLDISLQVPSTTLKQ